MKPHIIDFLKFLESKENKKVPLEAKLLHPNKFSPLTKEELYVDGDFDLSSTNIKSLPDNLTVGGDLDISYTVINAFPNNLKIGGNLYLWDTPLARRMTREEIRQEIEQKGGYVKGYVRYIQI